ncbi:hydroxypyruvate isomerase family protein [Alkanindiges sp. WGS2144]|uniref:hydroxypyruvate isomerase family protein n=1 Tax=Alkanindiges sp. WGS2144 TaxID=3366808 RepID=UPI00375101A8
MLQFSANLSMLFTEVPLLERFALARQQGFNALEIQFPYELSIDAIRQQLEQNQQQLVLINAPAGNLMQGGDGLACVPGREYEFRQAVFHAIHYASALSVPCINILAGRQSTFADLLPCLETMANNLRFACNEMTKADITPVFEIINGIDMPRFLIQTMAQAQEMLEAVNHPALKIQFDCYHLAMMHEPILPNLQENLAHIGHIQFADYPNRHEPGTGELNFHDIFAFIQQSNYQGFVGAEYRPLSTTSASLHWYQPFIQQ